MKEKIAIYGSGGFAREINWLICRDPKMTLETAYYIDDSENRLSKLKNIPVLNFEEFLKLDNNTKVIVGIGNPKTRKLIADKISTESIKFIWSVTID